MFAINGRSIGPEFPPYLVAEIGQNHNGSIETACQLVEMAVGCGVDAVKFQLRNAEAEFSAEVLDAPHPHPENAYGHTYREHRRELDLTIDDLLEIRRRIRFHEWPVHMFATPCWLGAVDELEERFDSPAYKVASKDLTNEALVRRCGQTGKPVILSTGMAQTFMEITDAVFWLKSSPVLVCQCTSQYPCDPQNVNLGAIPPLREWRDGLAGFSDHTIGIKAGPIAVALGASLIEKHVTLSRAMKGTDHAVSLEEDGLRRYVRDCREAWVMRGSELTVRPEFVTGIYQKT